MAWCDECDRYFVNEYALQQHLDYAPVHRPVYHCGTCDLYFSNAHGLEQHTENSIKHLKRVWNYVCEPCKWGCSRVERMEEHDEAFHHWCKLHNRFFNNENDLRQHQLSKGHGQSRKCPGCSRMFPTFTAITLHLESGTCESGMNRRKVDQRVHDTDKSGIFTRQKLLGYGEWEPELDVWATDRAWNGRAYECYFCDREYNKLGKLNGHITQFHAPKRTEEIYHCPGCGKQFKYVSQLIGHVEHTGACNVRENRKVKSWLASNQRTLTMG